MEGIIDCAAAWLSECQHAGLAASHQSSGLSRTMAAAQQAEYDCISSLDEVGNIAGELLDGCVVEALDVSE